MKIENKFIMINNKRFDEMRETKNGEMYVKRFLDHLEGLVIDYERLTGKKMDQCYMACNVDEPYAMKVLEIISEGEDNK